MNWDFYKNFEEKEFTCSHTKETFMDVYFMNKLQELRTQYNKPIHITSGYRHYTHPAEKHKNKIGEHVLGKAVDIKVDRQDAYKVLQLALKLGFTRIGVSQKGEGRFLHLGTATTEDGFLSPTIWSY